MSSANPPTEPAAIGGDRPGEPKLQKYFLAMTKLGASDLHIKPGVTPHMRVNTRIVATQGKPLPNALIAEMAMELMSDRQKLTLEQEGGCDLAYEIEGGDRFRVNVFRQRGHVAIAARRVSRVVPSFSDLHLPPEIAKIAEMRDGLILLSGPTGAGKSTTISSMIEHVNRSRPCHIVTIEDPIEYLYESKKSLVSQREVGIDVPDFQTALKYLMREDPDVVLIGEMRDRHTLQAALQASETGHLVLGTIHASSAAQTVTRILDLFPADDRRLVRQSLAFNLRAVICQRLLPSILPGVSRIPAVEILLNNPSIRQLLQEERDAEIPDVIRSCERDGMRSMTRSLLGLIEQNAVDPKIAYEAAPNVDELKMLLSGISSTRPGLLGR